MSAAASLGLLSIVGLAWWASPPAEKITVPPAADFSYLGDSASPGVEAAPMRARPAFLTMRLQQNWSGEMVIKRAFRLLDAPANPEREPRFVEFLATLNAGQLQALETALTTSQAQGHDRAAELSLLWRYWVGFCPSSAQIYADTDPQRTRHLGQALSSLNAGQENAILTQLTKP